MTITSDDIKRAFAPIANIAKAEPVAVDLEAVATALISKTADFANADDPIANLPSLEETVNKIDAMLDKAIEDEHGKVTVAGSDFAKGFMFGRKPEEKKKPSNEDAEKKAPASGGDAEKTEKADDVDSLSDSIDWENDLSPTHPPTTRSERLTKGERPIPARQGGLKAIEKMATAREKALARRDERNSGSGRTLS